MAESFGHTVFCTRFEAYARSQRFDIVNLSTSSSTFPIP